MKWFKVRNVSISTFEAYKHQVFPKMVGFSIWVMSDDQWTFVEKRQVIFTYWFFLRKHLYCSFGEERHSDYQICNAAKQQLKVSSGGGTLQLLRINIEGIVQGFIDCPFMRLEFQCWLTVHIVQVSESRLANGTAMIGAFGSVKTRSQAVPFAPCSTYSDMA